MNRKHTIEFLQRCQRGRVILSDWISRVREASDICVTADDFLDLVETEQLRAAFYDLVRNGTLEKRFVPKEGLPALLSDLGELGKQNAQQMSVLFHSMDRFIGALRIESSVVLANPEAVWKVSQEDLALATEDLQSGLCLEENYYNQSGDYVADGIYEVTAWGTLSEMWGQTGIRD